MRPVYSVCFVRTWDMCADLDCAIILDVKDERENQSVAPISRLGSIVDWRRAGYRPGRTDLILPHISLSFCFSVLYVHVLIEAEGIKDPASWCVASRIFIVLGDVNHEMVFAPPHIIIPHNLVFSSMRALFDKKVVIDSF